MWTGAGLWRHVVTVHWFLGSGEASGAAGQVSHWAGLPALFFLNRWRESMWLSLNFFFSFSISASSRPFENPTFIHNTATHFTKSHLKRPLSAGAHLTLLCALMLRCVLPAAGVWAFIYAPAAGFFCHHFTKCSFVIFSSITGPVLVSSAFVWLDLCPLLSEVSCDWSEQEGRACLYSHSPEIGGAQTCVAERQKSEGDDSQKKKSPKHRKGLSFMSNLCCTVNDSQLVSKTFV